MKRYIAITFLFAFLSANTAFGQLLKLPALIQHYHLHCNDSGEDATDHDLGFFAFLAEHYGGKCEHSHKKNHQQDHQNLPFHQTNIAASNSVVIPDFQKIILPPVLGREEIQISYIQNFYPSSHLATIWQPPRLG